MLNNLMFSVFKMWWWLRGDCGLNMFAYWIHKQSADIFKVSNVRFTVLDFIAHLPAVFVQPRNIIKYFWLGKEDQPFVKVIKTPSFLTVLISYIHLACHGISDVIPQMPLLVLMIRSAYFMHLFTSVAAVLFTCAPRVIWIPERSSGCFLSM